MPITPSAERTVSRGLLLWVLLMGIVGCSRDAREDPEVQQFLAELSAPADAETQSAVWSDRPLFDPSTALTDRSDEAGELWRHLRAAYPFGLQGVAVSTVRADGSCAVVVAEPPPDVSLSDVAAYVDEASVMQLPVGHDGAIFDVVGTLSGGPAEIDRKLRLLNVLLFKTDYKAHVYREPFRKGAPTPHGFTLDIQPTPAEIMRWLYAADARFEPVGGGTAVDLAAVTQEAQCGVHRAIAVGLVGWWIPHGVSPAECLLDARVFSVESDLVVGAIETSTGVLVLARQREVPFDVLPPLRSETIALLASVKDEDELAQSYQRTAPGAGPYSAAFDWAPIWLSPVLVDTEYGQLLNIADQLLKGWSQNGEVSYERFDYRKPAKWPFEHPLSKIVHDKFHKDTLTFNWNTTGAGYAIQAGPDRVYATFRTGALPISYIPGEDPNLAPEVTAYEEQAYQWYASLNDPTLVRVVQYAAIYQIFHNLDLTKFREDAPKSTVPSEAFAKTMAAYWDRVDASDSTPGELADGALATRFKDFFVRQAAAEMPPKGTSKQYAQLRELAMKLASIDLHKNLEKNLQEGHDAWRSLTSEQRDSIRRAGGTLDEPIDDDVARDAAQRATFYFASIAARDRLADRYSSEVRPSPRSWTHTPTVVMSNPGPGNPGSIGGHNLRATISNLGVSSEIEAGSVRVRRGVVELSQADMERAPALVRRLARGVQAHEEPTALAKELESVLKTAQPRPPRVPSKALELKTMPIADEIPPAATVGRVGGRSVPPPDVQAIMADAHEGPPRIVLLKRGDHIWVGGPPPMPAVPTSNLADASELAAVRLKATSRAASKEGQAHLQLTNFSEEEQATLMKQLRSDVKRRGHSEDVVGVVGKENSGRSWRLTRADYDFERPKITVEAPKLVEGQLTSKVTVELTARRPGLRNAVIEFWIRVKGALSETQLAKLATAIELRIRELLGKVATGEPIGTTDPVLLLQSELKRVGERHGVEIETRVRDAADDYRLVTAKRTSHAA